MGFIFKKMFIFLKKNPCYVSSIRNEVDFELELRMTRKKNHQQAKVQFRSIYDKILMIVCTINDAPPCLTESFSGIFIKKDEPLASPFM